MDRKIVPGEPLIIAARNIGVGEPLFVSAKTGRTFKMLPYKSWTEPLTFEPSTRNPNLMLGECGCKKDLELKEYIEVFTIGAVCHRREGSVENEEEVANIVKECLASRK